MILEQFSFINYLKESNTISIDRSRDSLLSDFSKATLKDRYLVDNESFQDRFATVACYYGNDSDHAQTMYNYISQLWFMPATPITGNGGTDKGLPISCFLNWIDDTLKSILYTKAETNWLSALGGGTGTCWSAVRSIGEPIKRVGRSGGVIPFICSWEKDSMAISQGSLRRGSNAAYLSVEHPEFVEFMNIRKPTGGDPNRKANNIHHGAVLPDAFMDAVANNEKWNMVSPLTGEVKKAINAREIWQDLLETRVATGEPYLFFVDNANRQTNPVYKQLGLKIHQSNLCVEICETTGPDHLGNDRTAVCDLGSVNLEHHDEIVKEPNFIKNCLLFLDNVLDDFISKTRDVAYFQKANYSASRERSVGLGVMGFHSYFQMNNIPFASPMAYSFTKRFFTWFSDQVTAANEAIAEERGACPDAMEAGIKRRFANATAIAPTASISIIAGNCSPGIDPYLSNAYTQKTLSGSFAVRNKWLQQLLEKKAGDLGITNKEEWLNQLWTSIMVDEGSVRRVACLSDYEKDVFATAFEIPPDWVIEHAGVYASKIDQGVSLNLFIPPDVDKHTLHRVHFKAWKKGIKGLYYLRSKSKLRSEIVTHLAGTLPTEERQNDPRLFHVNYDECLSCQ